MKKFFTKFTAIATLFIIAFFATGCEKETSYEKDVLPLIETTSTAKVHGSCNMIESESTCFDFIGEIFSEDRMRLSCEGGKFSLNSCPYSDIGGCQATPGTISESIVWSYNYGGQPVNEEQASYAAKACNSMGMSKWVLPADLLNQ